MKQLATIILLSIATISSAFASTDPVPVKVSAVKYFIENTAVEVSYSFDLNEELFVSGVYLEEAEALVFETTNNISYIQIFNAESLEFQLPVMSNQVKIGKSIFGEGEYKIGFIIEGEDQIQFADVKIK